MKPAAQFAFVRHSDEGLLVQEIDRDGNLEYLHSDDQSWDSLGGTWEIVAISDLTEEEKESAVFEEWEDKVIDSELFPSSQANTLEITKTTRATFHTTVTFCETAPDGSRDGFQTVEVQHDSPVPCETDSAEVQAALAAIAAERGLEF